MIWGTTNIYIILSIIAQIIEIKISLTSIQYVSVCTYVVFNHPI